MADSGSTSDDGREHPDGQSDAQEEFGARQRRFLARKAERLLARLEARDNAAERDAQKGVTISLEDLIAGTHQDPESVWYTH